MHCLLAVTGLKSTSYRNLGTQHRQHLQGFALIYCFLGIQNLSKLPQRAIPQRSTVEHKSHNDLNQFQLKLTSLDSWRGLNRVQ